MPGQQLNNQSNTGVNNDASFGASQGIGGYSSPYSNPMPPSITDNSQPANSASQQQQPTNAATTNQQQVQQPNIQDFLSNPGSVQAPAQPISTPPAQIQTQSQIPSDNLLDDADQVNEILKDGQTPLQPQPNSQSISQVPSIQTAPQTQVNEPNPIPTSSQQQIEVKSQVVETPQPVQQVVPSEQKIEVQIPQAKVEITPAPISAEPKVEVKEQIKSEPKKEVELPTVSNVQKSNPVPSKPPMPKSESPVLDPLKDLAKMNTKDEFGVDTEKKFTKISELLDIVIDRGASDLHLTVGYPPFIRVDDKLVRVGAVLTKEDVKTLIFQTLSQNQKELLEVNREVDLSYQHLEKGRFRINAYFESGTLAAAYRLIPQRIKTVTELNLPGILLDFTRLSQGLFLVTGPTGSGKSTTLAAMIQSINATAPKHLLTIEDPIEYIYPVGTALVDQRELGSDTHDWSIAMRSALRQDPDVILIGELRDFETIQLAITLAETGHLVFATLHTSSAAQSIDRIIDVFPPYQQQQIKTQLAGVLKGILSQRLVPLIGGGRQAVTELLIVTPAVQNLIREGKTYQIDNVISTSADVGMLSLEKSLVKLVRQGKITTGTAQDYAIRPEEILKLMKSNQL